MNENVMSVRDSDAQCLNVSLCERETVSYI